MVIPTIAAAQSAFHNVFTVLSWFMVPIYFEGAAACVAFSIARLDV
jgi:hypothetical protein